MFKDSLDFFRNIILGKENDVVVSAEDTLKERISSPFYGYFLISWIIFNWKFIYIAFFVSEEKIFQKTGLLREEYLWLNSPVDVLGNIFQFVLYPFMFSLFAIFVLPYISQLFFWKSVLNKRALLNIEKRLNEKIAEKIDSDTKVIVAETKKKVAEKSAEAEAPEVLWEREFEKFKKNILYLEFGKVIYNFYKGNEFSISASMAAFLDLNGLGNVQLFNSKVALEEKGKFFVKKYLEINPNALLISPENSSR